MKLPFCRIKDITSVNNTFHISAKTKNSNFSRSISNFSILTPTFSRDGFYESCFQNPSENSDSMSVKLLTEHLLEVLSLKGGRAYTCQNVKLLEISSNDVFLSLKIVFILANNADSDEMLPNHLGLHCLPQYLFTCMG